MVHPIGNIYDLSSSCGSPACPIQVCSVFMNPPIWAIVTTALLMWEILHMWETVKRKSEAENSSSERQIGYVLRWTDGARGRRRGPDFPQSRLSAAFVRHSQECNHCLSKRLCNNNYAASSRLVFCRRCQLAESSVLCRSNTGNERGLIKNPDRRRDDESSFHSLLNMHDMACIDMPTC